MSKYTPWFPPNLKPVHAGPYRTPNSGKWKRYAVFADGAWWCWANTPEWAMNNYQNRYKSSCQYTAWRGLTAPHPEYKQGNTK